MTWTYDEENQDPKFLRQVIAFLQSCLTQRGNGRAVRPNFVPSRVRVTRIVASDIPGGPIAFPADYDCDANQWGAISVQANNGSPLGVKPDECIILAMKPNPYVFSPSIAPIPEQAVSP
jgi:hypothetical protein